MKKNILIFLGISTIIIIFKYNIGIPCIFFELTNLYCPGCGMTRAIKSLLLLDFSQAIRYNALIIILPLLIFSFIFEKKVKIPNWIWYLLLIIVILYGILRNITAFNFLAPTII